MASGSAVRPPARKLSSRAPSDASGLEGWSEDADDWSRISAPPEVYSVSPTVSTAGSESELQGSSPKALEEAVEPRTSSSAQPQAPVQSSPAPARPAQPSRLRQSSEISPAPTSPQPSPSAEPHPRPASTAKPAGAAWGGWGAISGWKDAITTDIKQLTDTLQHALHDDSEDDDARSSSTPKASTSSPRHRAPGRPESPLSAEAIRRQAVISRLQGPDNSLEVGLKVILGWGQSMLHSLHFCGTICFGQMYCILLVTASPSGAQKPSRHCLPCI